MKVENKNLIINPSCGVLYGYNRGSLIDLLQNNYSIIPNSLLNRIKQTQKINYVSFNNEGINTNFKMHINFLLKNKYAFWVDRHDFEFITKVSHKFNSPNLINNCIIDFKKKIVFEWEILFDNIENLRCKNIQLRFFEPISDTKLISILDYLAKRNILSVEILINDFSSLNKYKSITKKYKFINNIYIFSRNTSLKSVINGNMGNILVVNDRLLSEQKCGIINNKLFVINIETYSESQCHNTCLNRKISIDADGYIKNCPSMKHHYGHISDNKLIDVVRKPEFRKWWYYKKDDIDVCKDCEFRHICSDCRAFIKDPDNIYSQPAKCGYNPYIAKWKGQEGWISVEQWRNENPGWEKKAEENRAMDEKVCCEEHLKEEKEYFANL